MAVLTIKSLPEPLHRSLKDRAAQHKRSLTQEVLFLLEAAVAAPPPFDAEEELKKIRAFRDRFSFSVTPGEITAARHLGRKP